jgi:hypothetical protein
LILSSAKSFLVKDVSHLRGSNPGGDKIFRTHLDRSWGPPSLLYNGYRVFSGGKAAGAWCYHPPHIAPRLKKEQSYTSVPPLGLRGLLQGELCLNSGTRYHDYHHRCVLCMYVLQLKALLPWPCSGTRIALLTVFAVFCVWYALESR